MSPTLQHPKDKIPHSTGMTPDRATREEIENNFRAVLMIKNGFTTHAVSKATGLTAPQINYRVKLYSLTGIRGDFRNNNTDESQAHLRRIMRISKAEQTKQTEFLGKVRAMTLHVLNSRTKRNERK